MWNKLVLLSLCFTGSCFCSMELPSDDQVIDYLEGMIVPNFEAEVYHKPMMFQYAFENVKINKLSRTGSTGEYDITDDAIRVKLHMPDGNITGYMSSVITMANSKTFKYIMNGNFTLHATKSDLMMEVLLPKFGGGKTSALVMTKCSAKYEALTMDLDAKTIKDPKDMDAMNKWLSKALHTTLSDLYCIGLRADIAKGLESTVVQGITQMIFLTAFPSSSTTG